MATSLARRLCLLKVSQRLGHRCTTKQDQQTVHTSCPVTKKEGSSSVQSDTSTSGTKDGQVIPDNLVKDGLQPKVSTKAQKINRAMVAYMERAKSHGAMMQKEIDEYDLGRRHLANIMGEDPDLFEQEDIDKAIEYLLPSGLFDKKARPVLKHPYEIFPKRKAAEFGLDGRPFHTMFYTGKPNFYSLLSGISLKMEELKKEEDKLVQKGLLDEVADKKLQLFGSEWITTQNLKDLMMEPIGDLDHKRLIVLLERLAEHPLSFKEEEFIMKYRRKMTAQSLTSSLSSPQADDQGRAFVTADGKRKTCQAQVTLWNKGTGKVTINGQSILYFSCITDREQLLSPLQFVGRLEEVDVEATVTGGGKTGQAGAVRLALSRALASFVDADTREKMRIAGLLSTDFRRKERKKPGQKRARKKFTWKKR